MALFRTSAGWPPCGTPKEGPMASLRADRRLYLTADKMEVVEEGDVRAAFLLAAAGRAISADDVARLNLAIRDGRIVLPGLEKKQEPAPEAKDIEGPETKDEPSAENQEGQPVADWPLKMDPDVYLERYPDGQHADLAREILGDQ